MIVEREIAWRSPLSAFAPLATVDGAMLLHGGAAARDARWSFIVAYPVRQIESRGAAVFIDGERVDATPFAALSQLHAERRAMAAPKCGAPFVSGFVGFAGYESGRFVEPTATGPRSPYALADFYFAAFDAVAAFDRIDRRTFLIGRSEESIAGMFAAIGEEREGSASAFHFDRLSSNFSESAYRRAVAEVVDRVRRGDLFQANISQRFDAAAAAIDPFDLFCAISAESTAPYGAFLSFENAKILSFSPERFFSVRGVDQGRFKISAEPIKGTRPRGDTAEDDARFLASLLTDPKDRAENIMIADLVRNDLSKVCEDHSINEDAICEPVMHETVHHLVSRISGMLRPDVNAADALAALFPCGSITGAPKVEAMRAIAEIEKTGRGPYCGAIGYIDDRGAADFSVAIRTAVAEGSLLSIQVGGGVTLRSDPQAEYHETLAKARHFLRRIGLENAVQ